MSRKYVILILCTRLKIKLERGHSLTVSLVSSDTNLVDSLTQGDVAT
jgi:hypothetical protein